ncbi:MAG TPA: protein kinase, partial [Gemmatimonadaceae bacterium]|nr:protein kinase [Gemmatimonadaceae bacterium]
MDLHEQLQHSLGSSYTLERELGGGGMAHVFLANETRLQRNVVVKVLSPDLAAGLSAERFEREIRLAASLQQANIVPVLSAGDMDGVPYYTMPYVIGESLRTLLTTRGGLPISEAVDILRDVARALSYAHAHGVVHRDIKPDNVLLSHGAAVVSDFGIAKAISVSQTAAREVAGKPTLTQVGTSIGTPAYMSPEQVAGDPDIDYRTDIYAFGCMAYELLAGHPPFSGASPQRVLAAHLNETPTPLRAVRVDTPAALASLVMRCLAKRAADRPASANELLQALSTITPGERDVKVAMPSRGPRIRRGMLALAAAVSIALIVAATWWRQHGRLATHIDRSIAVLPLTNLSGDKANDYFGEGLAEEITNALGKAGLRVIGRGSPRVLVARGLDAQSIARQLGVANVLQGAVQRSGARLRITVSLISAADGSLRWSENYDRDIKDVFAIQDEIAHSVASQLRITLAGGAGVTLAPKETDDPEAHALYLQGLYQLNRRTAQALRLAITLFEQAARRDPNYARAYAGIAMARVVLPAYDDVPADSMRAKAMIAADRALAIDSTLPEAHTALGYAHGENFENAAAERAFAKALSFDSSFATAHHWRALLLGHIGRYDDAIREAQHARALEPTSLAIPTAMALVIYAARRYATADSVLQTLLVLDSTYHMGVVFHARVLIEQGRFDKAIAIL